MSDPVTQAFAGASAYIHAQSLGALLRAQAARSPEDYALRMVGGEDWSWARLATEVGAVQAGLRRRGIQPGVHVALMCDNSLRMAAALCAVTGLGAVAVPINTALVGRSLSFVLAHSDAKVLIADPSYIARCIALEAITAERCVATGDGPGGWTEAFGRPADLVAHNAKGPDPALILYTSGTTGEAKGVILSHACTLTAAAAAAGVMLEATPQSVIHTCLPLFHCAAQQLGLWPALLSGAQLVLSPRFSATSFWNEIRHYHATAFHFVGPLTSMLWNAPASPDDSRHPPLIAIGGGPRVAWREFEERFNVDFVETYGMTETFGGCVSHRPHRGREGSVGKALDPVEIAVHDDAGNRVPAGAVGQIVIRQRRASTAPVDASQVLFSGYYKRPDLTAAAFREGWYQTGDLGSMDADEFLRYQSRARDIIRRRGENVSALEVEAAALEYPGITECGVVGVPSELGEEDILAVLVADAAAGPAPAMADVAAFLSTRLPAFAVPRYLCTADSLPKTATGRIQRHLLCALAETAYRHEPRGERARKA